MTDSVPLLDFDYGSYQPVPASGECFDEHPEYDAGHPLAQFGAFTAEAAASRRGAHAHKRHFQP